MLNFLRKKIISSRDAKIIERKNKLKIIDKFDLDYKIKTFGNKNKHLTFYVIQRSPGGGMFSNLCFVIHHLSIANELGFIPVIDMENFATIYNENIKIKNSFNSWDYYFEPVSKYKLIDVYKSKKVIITSSKTMGIKYFDGFEYFSKKHKKIIKKYIKFKNFLITKKKIFLKNNFYNKKILGVHFRGTDYKNMERHPLPATKKQIYSKIKKIQKKYNYDKIFLVTEEKDYFNFLSKEFNNLFIYPSILTDKKQLFFEKNIKSLRYKIGEENIINMMLLSSTNHILGISSHMINSAMFFSKRKILLTKIDNGNNSNNIFFAQFKWYLKKILPSFFFGFKIN